MPVFYAQKPQKAISSANNQHFALYRWLKTVHFDKEKRRFEPPLRC
nr:MAG TPA: hypothetical protein [Caudoviricetes sp.]DAZ64931.1 MAG TPA: hypothetical protein [Caudoviricetes sp.]